MGLPTQQAGEAEQFCASDLAEARTLHARVSDQPLGKFCVNCKHILIDQAGYHRCKSPQNVTVDMVNGGIKWDHCSSHRSTELGEICGRSGKWFERKAAS